MNNEWLSRFYGVNIPHSRDFHPDGVLSYIANSGSELMRTGSHVLALATPARRHALQRHVIVWALPHEELDKKTPMRVEKTPGHVWSLWEKLAQDQPALEVLQNHASYMTATNGLCYFCMGYAPNDPMLAQRGFANRGGLQSEPYVHAHCVRRGPRDEQMQRELSLLEPNDHHHIAKLTNAAGELAILHYLPVLRALAQDPPTRASELSLPDQCGRAHTAFAFGDTTTDFARAMSFARVVTASVLPNWHSEMVSMSGLLNLLLSKDIEIPDWIPQIVDRIPDAIRQLQQPGHLLLFTAQHGWVLYPFSAGNAGLEMTSGISLLRENKNSRR